MLEDIKLLLGITSTDKDNLLELLINQAIQNARLISGVPNLTPRGIESVICRMVVIDYNRLGTEGLSSESYSGVSYNYSEGYPEDILSVLKGKGKLKVLW